MENINDSFFDGHYKNIWRTAMPPAMTRAEVDFFIEKSGIGKGNKVLDLMCGYGRHALELARKGIEITAVDNLNDYVEEIRKAALEENLPVSALQANVLQFQPREKYDLVICMGNSISFFNFEDTIKLFSTIAAGLHTHAKFIFNSWMIAEIAIKHFAGKTWSYEGEIKFLADSRYLFFPSRIETESQFIAPGGKTEIKNGVDYIYSLNETETMLKRCGLVVTECWSIPGKKKFTIGEPRIYVVAEKIKE